MAARPLEELPLVGLNHHGYYHGIIMKRLVAGYAGAPFGHEFAVLEDYSWESEYSEQDEDEYSEDDDNDDDDNGDDDDDDGDDDDDDDGDDDDE